MNAELVLTLSTPPIFELVLNRPEKRNALNAEMISAIRAGFEAAASDPAVHVLLLSAQGPDFCAGFDLKTVDSAEAPETRAEREREFLFDFSLRIRDHPTPTIALVQGADVAAGLLLSQACDLVVAADNAYFYNPLPRMGGVGLEVLWEPFDVGFRRAKRILFTGGRIDARSALEMGMVTDVVARDRLADFGKELAAQVAALPPATLRLLKQSINSSQDIAGLRTAQDQHFGLHQQGHQTSESRRLLHENREGRSLKDYFAQRDTGEEMST